MQTIHYTQALTQAIKAHKLFKKHSQLKADKWTKSGFNIAADMMSAQLDQILSASEKAQFGTTISGKTLTNIFNGSYRIAYPIDPRTLATLSKIVRFLGYNDWSTWADEADSLQQAHLSHQTPEARSVAGLYAAIDLEFRLYHQLPQLDLTQMETCFLPKSPAFAKVADQLLFYQKSGLSIANPYNPSTYEILECACLDANEQEARIQAKVYWLLCFWDNTEQKYIKRHKTIENYYFKLKQLDSVWKVISVATIADTTETMPTDEMTAEAIPAEAKPSKKTKAKSAA